MSKTTFERLGIPYEERDGIFYPVLVAGTEKADIDVVVNSATNSIGDSEVIIRGKNFTKWSRVYVNDKKVNTIFSSADCLVISKDDIEDGDTVKVCQLGSNDTIFRSSNEITYADPDVKAETEEPTEGTENTGDNN